MKESDNISPLVLTPTPAHLEFRFLPKQWWNLFQEKVGHSHQVDSSLRDTATALHPNPLVEHRGQKGQVQSPFPFFIFFLSLC